MSSLLLGNRRVNDRCRHQINNAITLKQLGRINKAHSCALFHGGVKHGS